MQELVQRLKEKAGLDSEPTLNPTIHQQMIEQLSADFERFFQNPDFQIELPKDFVDFIQMLGDTDLHLRGLIVFNWKTVIEYTPFLLNATFNPEWSKEEVWLPVAEFSDKNWYFLCGDPTSANFGKVAEGYDNTPWWEYGLLDIEEDNFKDFLVNVLLNW